jgi:hypothetical protein
LYHCKTLGVTGAARCICPRPSRPEHRFDAVAVEPAEAQFDLWTSITYDRQHLIDQAGLDLAGTDEM